MMKIDLYVPEWANWMVKDSDGWWYFYERKPYILAYVESWYADYGKVSIAYQDENGDGWRDSLCMVC